MLLVFELVFRVFVCVFVCDVCVFQGFVLQRVFFLAPCSMANGGVFVCVMSLCSVFFTQCTAVILLLLVIIIIIYNYYIYKYKVYIISTKI